MSNLSRINGALHSVQISTRSEHLKQFISQAVQLLLISIKKSAVHEAFQVFDSNFMSELGFPRLSNFEQEIQDVEFVHVSQGNSQSWHVFVVVFPKVPEGQSFVQRLLTKNKASVFPH